jgi:predicted nucleic acid-binding protein
LIVCDTGPLISALNRRERRRHRFAVALLSRLGRQVVVPWPVLVEVDLLLRARVLTWDFRRFRAVVLRRGHQWPLVVEEAELPAP